MSRALVIATPCGPPIPWGRIPALVLDDGETLIDSSAIVDHLDQTHGGVSPLTPPAGPERRHVKHALVAVDAMIDPGAPFMLFDRISQADITAFVAERRARVGLGIDTKSRIPRLSTLAMRFLEEPAFSSTEP